MNFRHWINEDAGIQETPFEVNGKQYLMKFIPVGLNGYFPYSPIAGTIYRVVWLPIEKKGSTEDERYARTGGNSVGTVRQLIRSVQQLVGDFLARNKPHGITWTGNDPTLKKVWDMCGKMLPQIGYVLSKNGNNVYLRKDIYDKAHVVEF